MHIRNVTFNSDVINDESHFYFSISSRPFDLIQFSLDENKPFIKNLGKAYNFMMQHGIKPLLLLVPFRIYYKVEEEADQVAFGDLFSFRIMCEGLGLRYKVMIPDSLKERFVTSVEFDRNF